MIELHIITSTAKRKKCITIAETTRTSERERERQLPGWYQSVTGAKANCKEINQHYQVDVTIWSRQ